ncbi:MAG: acyl-CoA dehydrogenase, partial [Bacteroidaceae bacterium]|nr:acyl-CoA dehydrogenase [Bacteroidaceae bacterium]
DSFTPLSKGLGSEFCNQNVYDCVQVHGGSGYMKDYACERLYRDARVTNIYEGTTQMQVIAAIRYATSGFYAGVMKEFAEWEVSPEIAVLKVRLDTMVPRYEESVNRIVELKDQEITDLTARRLIEMAGYIIMGYLLLQDATTNAALFANSAHIFVRWAEGEIDKHAGYISRIKPDETGYFRQS